MDPSAGIAVIETDLRRLVSHVMQKARGDRWFDEVVDLTISTKLEARRLEEQKRRAPAHVTDSLLAYSHFYEIRSIIEKHWGLFSPALGSKKEFSVLADKVEDFRNAPAHSRELLPHERSLLDGIAGTIRTQVTTYVSASSPDAKHYPIIESIRDSFGNEAALRAGDEAMGALSTGIRLQVGDVVTFEARGWDPQGRELTWALKVLPSDNFGLRAVSETKGTDVSISWTTSDSNVSATTIAQIDLVSTGPYHRHQGFDYRVNFIYSVDPPE